ncbi:hypothetical protein ACROYT_G043243 [Oculina patagonica]
MPISALQSTLYCPANFTFLNRQVHIPTLQISSFCTSNLTFLCTANLKFSVISALPVARVHKAKLTFQYFSISCLSTDKFTFAQWQFQVLHCHFEIFCHGIQFLHCKFHISSLPIARFYTTNLTFLYCQFHVYTVNFTFLQCQFLHCKVHFTVLPISRFLTAKFIFPHCKFQVSALPI